jgi:hypothetical protein
MNGVRNGNSGREQRESEPVSLRPTRIDVAIKALLTTSDGHKVQVMVRDLSAGGFRLTMLEAEELLVGETVVLDVAGGDRLRGTIRWSAGREAGGSFL